MELVVKHQKENPLLHRKELTGMLSFTGATPSNKQLQEELAKKINAAPDTVAIKNISGTFGGTSAAFEAFIYENKEHHDTIEPKKKEKKTAEGAAAPAKK